MSVRDVNPVDAKHPKRVAIVIANPAISTTTGWPVGFWWSELTHPWLAFTERGYEVEIFSPDGGRCEADALSDPRDPSGYSETDLISLGFISTPKLAALVETTRSVTDLAPEAFDAIVVAGGQSPMFTYEHATELQAKFVTFHETGKIAAALCHGTALLRYARRADGSLLAADRTVTGFANIEEDYADHATWEMGALERGKHLMPWRIEDALKSIGANYVQAGLWRSFAVRDGNLITGQQNFSGAETARLSERIAATKSGWLAARVTSREQILSGFSTSMGAHSSPVYLEVPGKATFAPEDAAAIGTIIDGARTWVETIASVASPAERARLAAYMASSQATLDKLVRERSRH